jgi:hypothetical protein
MRLDSMMSATETRPIRIGGRDALAGCCHHCGDRCLHDLECLVRLARLPEGRPAGEVGWNMNTCATCGRPVSANVFGNEVEKHAIYTCAKGHESRRSWVWDATTGWKAALGGHRG